LLGEDFVKILRYEVGGEARYGILEEDASIRQLIGSPFEDFEVGDKVAQLDQVRLLAPVVPDKVIGVGLNYKDHIEESGKELPAFPMLFMKPSTAVIAPEESIMTSPAAITRCWGGGCSGRGQETGFPYGGSPRPITNQLLSIRDK
jgi:2-keto-4-pentenoate hydratase/2-oxohepta-3-ene-1,7-dioic acid hydratase in catechol pathway